MRKGRRRIDWTTEELRYLRENAGKVPLRDICRHLKRSYKSVTRMAERMRLSLRCRTSRLVWCTKCATYRTSLREKTGHCSVCFKRDQLARAKVRTAEAYAALSTKDKAIYASTMTRRETVLPPRPRSPEASMVPRDRNERLKAEEDYARALERWEIKCLDKLINAEKTLTKRMRLKTSSNPRKKNEMNGENHLNPW